MRKHFLLSSFSLKSSLCHRYLKATGEWFDLQPTYKTLFPKEERLEREETIVLSVKFLFVFTQPFGVAKIPIIGCFALAIYPWKINSVRASSTSWLIRLNGNFGVLDISSAKFVENVKHSSGSCFFNQLIDTTVRIHYTLFTKISFLKKHSNLRWPSLQDKLF